LGRGFIGQKIGELLGSSLKETHLLGREGSLLRFWINLKRKFLRKGLGNSIEGEELELA